MEEETEKKEVDDSEIEKAKAKCKVNWLLIIFLLLLSFFVGMTVGVNIC